MGYMVQKYIVEDAKKASPLMPQHIALVDPKGKPVQLGGSAPAAGSIDAAKLAENAVETSKVKDGAITDAKLAANSVGEGNIKNGAVTAAKVKDGTLTAAKLAAGVLPVAATKTAPGIVKQAAKVDDCAAADANGCKATINALLESLRDAGVLATS